MSRSYRKVASASTGYKDGKRFANKKVRRTELVSNGSFYRKVYPSWDINDQGSAVTYKTETLKRWLEFEPKYRLYMK